VIVEVLLEVSRATCEASFRRMHRGCTPQRRVEGAGLSTPPPPFGFRLLTVATRERQRPHLEDLIPYFTMAKRRRVGATRIRPEEPASQRSRRRATSDERCWRARVRESAERCGDAYFWRFARWRLTRSRTPSPGQRGTWGPRNLPAAPAASPSLAAVPERHRECSGSRAAGGDGGARVGVGGLRRGAVCTLPPPHRTKGRRRPLRGMRKAQCGLPRRRGAMSRGGKALQIRMNCAQVIVNSISCLRTTRGRAECCTEGP
jgi:hypothetical protein